MIHLREPSVPESRLSVIARRERSDARHDEADGGINVGFTVALATCGEIARRDGCGRADRQHELCSLVQCGIFAGQDSGEEPASRSRSAGTVGVDGRCEFGRAHELANGSGNGSGPVQAPAPEPKASDKRNTAASNAQLRYLTDLWTQGGGQISELNARIRQEFGVEGLYELKRKQASTLLDKLKTESKKAA